MADVYALKAAMSRPGGNDVGALQVNMRGYAAKLDVILTALGIPVGAVIPPSPTSGKTASSPPAAQTN
jgi:hypothetical protein